MTPWQILSHTFSTISEDAAAEVELSRLITRRCTKLFCRLCLDALFRQSKGRFGAHVLLCDLKLKTLQRQGRLSILLSTSYQPLRPLYPPSCELRTNPALVS